MELFRFAPSDVLTDKLILENAQVINGLTNVMWVERYRDSGEFTLTAPMYSGLKDFLPVGSIVSHTGTTEIMVVENHSISDTQDAPAEITISGRSFESFLENRIISGNGAPGALTADESIRTYTLGSGKAGAHAASLIEQHVYLCTPYYLDDAIDNVRAIADLDPSIGTATVREIKVGSVYKAILELLELDDLGIRSVRPGPWLNTYRQTGVLGDPFYAVDDVGFIIYSGSDRRNSVSFSHDMGEIVNAEYLWSSKNNTNSVIVQGKWVRVRVNGAGAETSFERRVAYVEANDIDDRFASKPAGADYTQVVAAMTARGREVLAANKGISIARVEVTQNNPRFRFGVDYDVGDIVGVNGNYDIVGAMRVTEQVTIIDEHGYTSYPTLSTI